LDVHILHAQQQIKYQFRLELLDMPAIGTASLVYFHINKRRQSFHVVNTLEIE